MINPLNENILIKILKNEEEGQAVLLPDTHKKEEFGKGEVLAIEEGLPVQVGDIILFDTLLVVSVKIKDERLHFIKFSDILGYERLGESTSS